MQTLVRSSNPALSDEAVGRAAQEFQPGWASPGGTTGAPAALRPETMTMGGVATATGVLLALVLLPACFGWRQAGQVTTAGVFGNEVRCTEIPGWLFIPVLAGLGVAILTVFKPTFARFTAPIYALLQGTFLG